MASFGGSIKLTGADEYRNTLRQITQSLRETGTELTAVASKYDKNDKSLSTLNKKTAEMQGVLAKQVQSYNQLKSAYDSFNQKVSQQAQAHDKLLKTYDAEKQKLEEIKKTSGETSKEYQDQQKVVNDLASAVAKSSQSMTDNEIALSKMKTQLNQAEATVNKTAKEIDELGNETEEAGEKAKKGSEGYTVFKNILANLGTQAINSAINGIKQMGGALLNVGKQALNSYADFEQLKGGVETLFGAGGMTIEEYAKSVGKSVESVKGEYQNLMKAQDQVLKDSATAYKDAGLSANQYMETVTSFSASLIQSLDGDTAKASKLSKQAIIDMSDNANKMGTDMAMIQNAYQGFAKQNYTMLDNLKLGYGGTKGEMERLIADANRVKEANGEMADLSIDSFADVTEAIHIIQDEMGITGTTAKEASQTISGSVNAMKGAWQNMLTGMADENANFSELVNNLVDSIMTVGDNILPRIVTIIGGIGNMVSSLLKELVPKLIQEIPPLITSTLPVLIDAIQTVITALLDVLPSIVQSLSSLIPQIVQMILSMLPQLIEAGVQILLALVNGITEAIPQLIAMLPTIITQTVNTLISHLPEIVMAGIQLLIAIIQGIVEALPQLIDMLPQIIETIINVLMDNLPLLIDAGIQLLVAIINGIVKALPQLAMMVPKIILTVVKTFIRNLPQILTLGVKVIASIIQGIGQVLGNLMTTIGNVGRSIVNKFKELPSKMLNIGKNLVKGIWDGIKNAKDWVLEKIKGFGKAILDGIKGIFGIKSPSTVFRDEVGKNLALGLEEGFVGEMKNVTNEMQNAIPTEFDTNVGVNATGIGASAFSQTNMVDAFKQALSEMKVELNDEEVGSFVDKTVTRLIYN